MEVRVTTVVFVRTGCTDIMPAARASAADPEGVWIALSTSAARNQGPYAAARARGAEAEDCLSILGHLAEPPKFLSRL